MRNGRNIMEQKKDIFDKLLSAKCLRPFFPFYSKYKEQLLYIFFGGVTTLVSLGSFSLFTRFFGWNALTANVLSWLFSVFTAFITNRIWVFSGDVKSRFLPQMLSFYLGRTATLAAEELILLVFVTLLRQNAMAVKLVAQIVILILNYIISRVFIFKHSR